jgi:transcriptional regulator with XRE-family HTH domain
MRNALLRNLRVDSYLEGSLVLDFAGRISVCVTRAGGNQTEVGKLIGVTRSSVSQWVNGGTEPSPANALRLARIARVRPEWLILGEEPMEAVRIAPELLRALLATLEGAPDEQVREIINFAGYRIQQ